MAISALFLSRGKMERRIGLSEAEINQFDMEETYPEALGSLAVSYGSLDDIVDDADVIVYGTPKSSNIVKLDGFPQTHTYFAVSDVIKGELNVGDEIEVIEEGGYEGTVAGGIPKLTDSNSYILFLLKYKGSYYICGAFQGRFIEKSGYVFQQATEDVKLSRSMYAPIRTEDFIAEIKANE